MLKAINQPKMAAGNARRDLGKSNGFAGLDRADSDYESLNMSKISK